ncbi:MAG: hypothetical protein ABFD18_00345 [Syntrophomonas sp.]
MRNCNKQYHQRQITLTTGPFRVPMFNHNGLVNDRLVITIKNPTNKHLKANGYLELCPECNDSVGASSVRDGASFAAISCEGPSIVGLCLQSETRVCEFSTELNEDRCVSFEINIGDYPNATLRVTATGDFEECFCNPACGKLEMSVTGGQGAMDGEGPVAGLDYAEPTMFFPSVIYWFAQNCPGKGFDANP